MYFIMSTEFNGHAVAKPKSSFKTSHWSLVTALGLTPELKQEEN